MNAMTMVLLSLVMGIMAWVGTDNLFLSAVFFLLSAGYCLFYLNKAFSKHREKVQKKHECFQFINSFIIALSVKKTLGNAYQTVESQTSGTLLAEMKAIAHMDTSSALDFLLQYFNSSTYGLFLNVIHLYTDQGGDILVMGEFLVNEIRRAEEKLTLSETMALRKLVNFAVLWLMTLIILVFCRFGISGFYHQMLQNRLFLVLICFFLLFLLFSFHVFFQRYLGEEKKTHE